MSNCEESFENRYRRSRSVLSPHPFAQRAGRGAHFCAFGERNAIGEFACAASVSVEGT